MTKYHRVGGLNNINITSQLWKGELQDKSVGKFSFWWELCSWPVESHLLSVLPWPLLWVWQDKEIERERERDDDSGVSSFPCWIRASPLWLHLTLITSLNSPSLNTVILAVRASTYGLTGTQHWFSPWQPVKHLRLKIRAWLRVVGYRSTPVESHWAPGIERKEGVAR